jgi:hypothetical protein
MIDKRFVDTGTDAELLSKTLESWPHVVLTGRLLNDKLDLRVGLITLEFFNGDAVATFELVLFLPNIRTDEAANALETKHARKTVNKNRMFFLYI